MHFDFRNFFIRVYNMQFHMSIKFNCKHIVGKKKNYIQLVPMDICDEFYIVLKKHPY